MTNHPSALVSVPVEPTEAMLDAWHKATWPQGPRVSPLSQQGLSFARAYRAMLSAAPAAPQAAGVGEDDALLIQRAKELAALDGNFGDLTTPYAKIALTALANRLTTLRAPSREPEGGAVRELLREAGKQFRTYEAHHRAKKTNEAYEKAEINARLAERIEAALATREEAPAEATKAACVAWHEAQGENPFNVLYHGAWCGSFPHQIGPERWTFTVAAMEKAIAAYLRAQPQAREDAQPMAGAKALAFFKWARDFFWCEEGCEIDGGDFQNAAERFGLIVKVPFDPDRHSDNGYGLEAGDDWYETAHVIDQALAALQAEQGAK